MENFYLAIDELLLKHGLATTFADDPNVMVASDEVASLRDKLCVVFESFEGDKEWLMYCVDVGLEKLAEEGFGR